MTDEIIVKSYMKLVGAILKSAREDATKKIKKFVNRPDYCSNYTSERNYKDAVRFLKSDWCRYLEDALRDYNKIKGDKIQYDIEQRTY